MCRAVTQRKQLLGPHGKKAARLFGRWVAANDTHVALEVPHTAVGIRHNEVVKPSLTKPKYIPTPFPSQRIPPASEASQTLRGLAIVTETANGNGHVAFGGFPAHVFEVILELLTFGRGCAV